MRIVLAAVIVLAAFGSDSARAVESEFQISPRAGRGDLQIDAFQGLNDQSADTNTFGLGCGFGVLTPIGVVVEAGGDSYGDLDIVGALDSFTLSQNFAAVGYQFELGSGWRIVPKVGRTRWKLRSEEGMLFNPGPEATREIRGYDYYWEASVSRRISSVVALGVAYKQGDFSFGRSRTTSFLVTLGF
jgi:hypothetical protein